MKAKAARDYTCGQADANGRVPVVSLADGTSLGWIQPDCREFVSYAANGSPLARHASMDRAADCVAANAGYARATAERAARQRPTLDTQRLEMQYLGVCALLARTAGHPLDDENRILIKSALDDCAALFPGRFQVVAVSNRLGWALEPKR